MNTRIAFNDLMDLVQAQLTNELPFVLYKLPEKQMVKAIFQQNRQLDILENMEDKGFIFSPFGQGVPSVIFKKENCKFISSKIDHDIKATNKVFTEGQIAKLSAPQKFKHIDLVNKGLNFLKETGADKVVLARRLKLAFKNLNILKSFKNILASYPKAMVYLFYHPNIGIWMGASPEILVKIKNNTLETMALAGTQAYNKNLKVSWSSKEKKEQQFVSDFLIKSLDGLIDHMEISKTKNLKAGNLLHLCTKIKGQIKHTSQIKEIVEKIHPTPAVCGIPQKEAKEFIESNEGIDRKYYTGYFGELNLKHQTNLYVNLRCMEVQPDHVNIYIGGGITKDSRPEDEFLETLAKSKIMLNILA